MRRFRSRLLHPPRGYPGANSVEAWLASAGLFVAQGAWQLGSGTYVELLVDVAQVELHGLGRDEQRFRHLTSRQALCRQVRDAALAGGERRHAALLLPAGPGTGRCEFGQDALGDRLGAAAPAELECFAERRAWRGP